MSAVDPVAAYEVAADLARIEAFETAVAGCHGAPPRRCCVLAGLDAVDELREASGWGAMLAHGAPDA